MTAGRSESAQLPAEAWHDSHMRRAWRTRDFRAVFHLACRLGLTPETIASNTGLPLDLVLNVMKGNTVLNGDSGVAVQVAAGLGMPDDFRRFAGLAPAAIRTVSVIRPREDESSLPGRPHVGERIAELRRERGLTQESLAERAGVSTETVKKIERRKRNPSLSMLETLANALGIAIGKLTDAPAYREAEPNSSQSETLSDPLRSSFASDMSDMVEAVKRREFILGMAATAGFGATGSVVPVFKHVDPELISYFRRQLEGHYRADMLLGPRALISTVTAQCKLIGQLIDSADEPTRQRMAVVGTSFATFAAWLYLDAGDIAAALHWHGIAQEMAHRSLDREAIACALVDRAMARTDQGMGTAVIDLCDSALMDARHLSPELNVFALQQKAHGASIVGDRRQVDALLDAAGRFVDQVDVEVWGVPCLRTLHYVEVHRATCYGRLGLAKEALGVWQQIIPDAPSTARRDVGVWVARQATLSASLGEPEWTVELARHAVRAALETGSARVHRELAATKATMAPWQAEPVGRDFAEVLAPISEEI